jgi:hypothetical protein
VIDAVRRFGPVRVEQNTVTTETVTFTAPKRPAARGSGTARD